METKFKVGDVIIITGYKLSYLQSEDVGKVVTVIDIETHPRCGFVCITKAFQSEADTNYVAFSECRLATPLDKLL